MSMVHARTGMRMIRLLTCGKRSNEILYDFLYGSSGIRSSALFGIVTGLVVIDAKYNTKMPDRNLRRNSAEKVQQSVKGWQGTMHTMGKQ